MLLIPILISIKFIENVPRKEYSFFVSLSYLNRRTTQKNWKTSRFLTVSQILFYAFFYNNFKEFKGSVLGKICVGVLQIFLCNEIEEDFGKSKDSVKSINNVLPHQMFKHRGDYYL